MHGFFRTRTRARSCGCGRSVRRDAGARRSIDWGSVRCWMGFGTDRRQTSRHSPERSSPCRGSRTISANTSRPSTRTPIVCGPDGCVVVDALVMLGAVGPPDRPAHRPTAPRAGVPRTATRPDRAVPGGGCNRGRALRGARLPGSSAVAKRGSGPRSEQTRARPHPRRDRRRCPAARPGSPERSGARGRHAAWVRQGRGAVLVRHLHRTGTWKHGGTVRLACARGKPRASGALHTAEPRLDRSKIT